MKNTLYSATCILLGAYAIHGFEFKDPLNIHSAGVSSENITAAEFKKPDHYCLVFEDHFDTLNFKNWQVKGTFSPFLYIYI